MRPLHLDKGLNLPTSQILLGRSDNVENSYKHCKFPGWSLVLSQWNLMARKPLESPPYPLVGSGAGAKPSEMNGFPTMWGPQTKRGCTGVLGYCLRNCIFCVLISIVSSYVWIKWSEQINFQILEGSCSSNIVFFLVNKFKAYSKSYKKRNIRWAKDFYQAFFLFNHYRLNLLFHAYWCCTVSKFSILLSMLSFF